LAIMLDIVIQRMENVRADVDNKHVNSLKKNFVREYKQR